MSQVFVTDRPAAEQAVAVARGLEITLAASALTDVHPNPGQVVMVTGRPGMGHHEVVRGTAERLAGSCTVIRLTHPSVAGPATAVINWPVAPNGPVADPARRPVQDVAALRALLATLRRQETSAPVLLVFEDPVATTDDRRALLVEAAGLSTRDNVLVLAWSDRPDDGDLVERLRARNGAMARVRLGPVEQAAVRAIVEAALSPGCDPETVDDAVRVAAGNPWLAVELAGWSLHLAGADRRLRVDELRGLLPTSTDLLGHRDRAHLLCAVSVCGATDGELVATVRARDLAEVGSGLEDLVRSGLATRDAAGAYRSVHPALTGVAEALVGTAAVCAMHRRAAAALADGPFAARNVTAVARHLELAGDRDAAAAQAFLAAGRWALERHETGPAEHWATLGLASAAPTPTRLALHRVLGAAAVRRNELVASLSQLQAAVELCDPAADPATFAEVVADYLDVAFFAAADGVRLDRRQLLTEALAACPAVAGDLRARLLSQQARFAVPTDFDRFRTSLHEAERIAAGSPDTRTRARVHAVRALNPAPHDLPELAASGLALQHLPGRAGLDALPALTYVALTCGRRDDLEQILSRFRAREQEHPDRQTRIMLAQLRIGLALLDGAERDLGDAVAALRAESTSVGTVVESAAASLWLATTGRRAVILGGAATVPDETEHPVAVVTRLAYAVAAALDVESGRTGALARLVPLLPDPVSVERDLMWASWQAAYAVVGAAAQDRELCRVAVEALAPFVRRLAVQGISLPIAPVGWLLAGPLLVLGRHDEALEANACAEAVSRSVRSDLWVAHCQVQRARILRSLGRLEPAVAVFEARRNASRTDLPSALDGLDRLGRPRPANAAPVHAQGLRAASAAVTVVVTPDAGATGDGPVPAPFDSRSDPGLGPLGRVDAHILWLAARGDTNESIARTVGLSMTSVERRLTRLYRRLGVRNRAQAVTTATREGWLRDPESPPAASAGS